MSMSARFNIRAADPAAVMVLQKELGLPRFVAATLVARGVRDIREACRFLEPSLDRDCHNPYIIPGLGDVVDALESAVRRGDHIVVFGDFDLDGISATTVLTRALRELGAHVTPFIPRRFTEGYALTPEAMVRLSSITPKPDFIITVDCGIACKDIAAEIVRAGYGLAVTDHHEPADLVPEGVPVCDPKLDENCPSSILAGVGVALKVVQAIGGRFGKPYLWRDYTDFATLGTVADLMPMRDENRALVADGLARINAAPRTCIAALLESSGSIGKAVTSTNLSYSVIPRLNAAGRMGDADLAIDLLMTDDPVEAQRLAARLEEVNNQRRSIEAELSELAKEEAEKVYTGQRALVVAGVGWHEGVKGIVASRLVNIYGVPTMLFTIDGEEARGSGRSVGKVNLFKAVESTSDLLTRFGGHDAAVGVTLPTKNLPEFAERLAAYMDRLPEGDFHPSIDIDACVDLGELTLQSVAQIDRLAPFGQENPVPCFLARDVTIANCRAVGADKNHFSCSLTDGRATVPGIMFHCSDIEKLMNTHCVVNAAFQAQIDEWRGRRSVKAMLQTIAPARMCKALEACLDARTRSFVADLYAQSDTELCADSPACPDEAEAFEAELESNRAAWEKRAREHSNTVENDIARAIIGDAPLHESQLEALRLLRAGESVLAVMATGRGKSLIFQVHAAYTALAKGQASLFVYPLRALIADQEYHMNVAFAQFGIATASLTGETSPEERVRIFEGVREGSIDVVLTTPEFLDYHAPRLAQTGRIDFLVVDEAHHIGAARAGHRPAYLGLSRAVATIAPSTVLALTATANEGVARDIMQVLPITRCVFDDASRKNLLIDDQRNIRNRDDYLANIVASGEKTVVYVNSREQSVSLARMLRRKVPQLAPMIGFYNAGLSRRERQLVEDLFRTDKFTVLVATSAFGEGVNIPNIRHVVLYHLPFSEIEFNQMTGRAGRDGSDAVIHLLYGRADASINERILHDATPDHDVLASVYRALRQRQRASTEGYFVLAPADLEKLAPDASAQGRRSVGPASCGLAVFRELGLIETRSTFVSGEVVRTVRVKENAARVELTDSVRYREGLGEQENFGHFRDWALGSDSATVRLRISRPIMPDGGSSPGGRRSGAGRVSGCGSDGSARGAC